MSLSKALNRLCSCLAEGRKPFLKSERGGGVLAKCAAVTSLGTFSLPIPQDFSLKRDLRLRFAVVEAVKEAFLFPPPTPEVSIRSCGLGRFQEERDIHCKRV